MMSLNKAIKKYQLIEFKDEQTNDGKLSVECVPSSWITFDASVGACMVRFLPPPYDKESFRLLTDLIKNHVDAPEGWPFYQCSLLGHAQTYPEAMKKLNKLQSRPYAYTTDNDDHAREKSVTMTQLYKALRSKEQDDLEKVMDVRGISSDVNANEIYSSSSSNGEDSTSDENTASLCQKKKKSTKKSEPVGKNDAKKKSVTASSCKISKRPSKTSGVSTQESKKSQPTPRASSAHSSHKKIISTSSDREMQPERELQMPELADNAQEHATRDQASLHRPKSPDAGLLVSAANENNVEENWEIIIGAEKGEKIVFSNDTKLLYIAINKLTCLVKSLSEESQTLRNSVERCMRLKINKMDKKKFEEKYAFEKPRTSVEFFVFDQRLTTEEDFHNDFTASLESLLESEIRSTTNLILKSYLTRELAMNCCAVRLPKSTSTKVILKGTRFYDIILGFLRLYFTGPQNVPIAEKIFYQHLSICLVNAKDWDGNRNMRRPLPEIVVTEET